MNQDLVAFESAISELLEQGNIEGALSAIRAMTETVVSDPAATGMVLRSPVLDELCIRIGRETLNYLQQEALLPPKAEQQADTIVLATELHNVGGHTRVVEDIIRLQPGSTVLILLTDFLSSQYEMDLGRLEALGAEVRRAAAGGSHTDRLLWTQMQLACHPDARVLVFNHHADAAAIAALQPGVNREVIFCHHGDHHLCLGASLKTVRHVDLFEAHCHTCRDAGLKAELWPLSVPDTQPRAHAAESFRRAGSLTTASCGHEAKFLAPYPYHYWDVLPLILKQTAGTHIHIGYLPEDVLEAIHAGLAANGIAGERFKHVPWVASLTASLRDMQVDLYIGSFPLGGGRTLIETMAVGVPIVTHAHSLQAMLASGGFGPANTWCWSSPDELLHILESATAEELSARSQQVRDYFLRVHSPTTFAAAVRGETSVAPAAPTTLVSASEQLATYLLRAQLRTETFPFVFELLETALSARNASPEELLAQGRALIAKRDYLKANDVLMQALESAPDDAFILFELGHLAFLGKLPAEGHDILEQAAAASHAVLPMIQQLGEAFVRAGDSENARIILNLLRKITNQGRPSDTPAEGLTRIRALSDHEWMEVLCRSHQDPDYHGFKLPGFPEEQFQINTMGSSNDAAMREAFLFYRSVLPFVNRMRPLAERTYLDFGTGWGRFARTFLKIFEPHNIHGIDVDPTMIQVCQDNFSFGNFSVCQPFPPTGLPDDNFDLITAYSVFSHLSEEAANLWVEEFARILRPGGFAIFTTQGRSFIDQCAYFRKTQDFSNAWHRQLAASFLDEDASRADYDAGKFLFAPTGSGESEVRTSSFYGESMIPASYMIRNWGNKFDLLTFIDDRSIMPQAFAVLRKK